MIWKTDWNKFDNLAQSGTSDIERIINNYDSIKNSLNTVFGTKIRFVSLILNGYFTIPFTRFLNAIEDDINKVNIFGVYWSRNKKTYSAYETAPNFEDINRWERNGENLERVIKVSEQNFIKCGTFNAGNIRIAQKIRR